MPGVNIVGRVAFLADMDGTGMDKDAERIGREAGAEASKGYDKEWKKGFRSTLSDSGKKSFDTWEKQGRKDGYVYAAGLKKRLDAYIVQAKKSFESMSLDSGFLDDFAKGYDNAGEAAGELQRRLQTLRDENELNNSSFQKAKRTLDAWITSQEDAAGRSAVLSERIRRVNDEADRQMSTLKNSESSFDGLRRKIDQLATSQGKLSLSWKDLSHNTRQWTLIIAAIASGAEDIAVLGSAAGAGLVALGGGLSAAAIGGIGLAAVFKNLNQDIKDAPAAMRPMIREFDNLKTVIGQASDEIALAAFDEIGKSFTTMGNSVSALTPQLRGVGNALGNLISDFAKATAPGAEGFAEIQTLVRNSIPLIDTMGRSAGTLGLSLVRAFNRANPLVQSMVNYVDTLVQRFDAFTQSTGFDEWTRHAQQVFGALGPLLDATGRALNNLVTDESVARTVGFLDDLTGFMPSLEQLLSVIGDANIFGLLAQGLNEFGAALQPLYGPLGDLIGAVSQGASEAIPAFASAIEVAATAIAPLVQAAADLIDALPDDFWSGAANGALVLAGAFAILRGANGISGALTALDTFTVKSAKALGATEGLAGKIGGMVGKAGAWGAAIAIGTTAIVALSAALDNAIDKANGWSKKSADMTGTNQDLASTLQEIYPAAYDAAGSFESLGNETITLKDSMKLLADSGGTAWGVSMNNAASATDAAQLSAQGLAEQLGRLDGPLSSLAQNNLPAASEQFSAWTANMGLSEGEMYNLITGAFPKYAEALTQQIEANGEVATQTNLVAAALNGLTPAQQSAADAAASNAEALADLQGKANDTTGSIQKTAEAIAGFGSAALTSRDASRQFEQAIDDASSALAGQSSTLLKGKTDFDINTEAGRKNQAAVDSVASAAINAASKIAEQTGSQDKANAAIERGRSQIIKMLEKLGMGEDAANDYADALGLIPENVTTAAKITGLDKAEAQLDFLARDRYSYINVVTGKPYSGGNTTNRAHAAGTITNGPEHSLIGEAGPEAVVPLDRPLSMVDESVRWLSAIAQGKVATTAMAAGGKVGPSYTFAPGSIVVQGFQDPAATAVAVLNRVTEMLY